jgi:hypothetical protein
MKAEAYGKKTAKIECKKRYRFKKATLYERKVIKLVMENFWKFSQVKTFPTMLAHRFLLAYFLRIICLGIFFYRAIYAFYPIIYVSGKFPEIFITNCNMDFACNMCILALSQFE